MTFPIQDGLLRNRKDEGGDGHEHAGHGEPHACGGGEVRAAGLGLLGLYIDDVVLLQVVVRRTDNVGVVNIELMVLLAACAVFTDDKDLIALAIEGQVARLGNGFEDIDLLVLGGEHTWVVDLAQDGVLIVDHPDMDNGILLG